MADKKFKVKQIDLIGASGTPNLTSPNNLNINAVTVAISTDVLMLRTLFITNAHPMRRWVEQSLSIHQFRLTNK